MSFLLQHSRLGFCWWDLLALAILIIVVAITVIRIRKMKENKSELEDELSALYADDTMKLDSK